ncbi:GNAT family N-acetyltransferase [Virgibacillus sp. DJP39]|uniref:GNAT family N-acetyltransferase n=1 Tax=Virgibacillus sp. DJP39 TaxID=3409790 RepID=UPI003BB53BAA
MTIRRATNHETQMILDHCLDVMKEATMGYVAEEKEKALEMITPFLSNGGFYLVYVENKIIKGWIGLGDTIDFFTDEQVGFIPELYVIPQYRRNGIAKLLCQKALIKFKEEGYRKVQLNVFSGNDIKKLYQELGFEETSTLMEKSLDRS